VKCVGRDFKCGCRCSGGHWFLCAKHEAELEAKLIVYEIDDDNEHFRDVIPRS